MSHKTLIAANILLTVAFVGVVSAFAQTTDTTAPIISGVGVSGITQTAATVDWTTNEPADSQVEYGTTTAYGVLSSLASATTTAHHVSLGSLTASTLYHYRVMSKDVAGNLATSSDATFTTLVPVVDTTAPVISGVTVSGISDTAATINWTTDEPADSQVGYGTTTAYGLVSPLTTATTTAHHIALSSLTASTTYHFIVKSKDVAGNLATSSDATFTTFAAPVVAGTTVRLSVEPRVLNTSSRGNWMEAEVIFPRGTDIRTLDLASIKLNGAIAPVKVKTSKQKWYEMFFRKSPKAEMKFSRAEVIDLLLSDVSATSTTATASSTKPVIEMQQRDLTVSGTIGGGAFTGTTKIYLVIRSDGRASPVIFEHEGEKKEEKHEKKESLKEKEEDEHRSERIAPATTTTILQTVTAAGQTTTAQESKREKSESSFHNPFSFISPFTSVGDHHEDEKKGGKEKRDH